MKFSEPIFFSAIHRNHSVQKIFQ